MPMGGGDALRNFCQEEFAIYYPTKNDTKTFHKALKKTKSGHFLAFCFLDKA